MRSLPVPDPGTPNHRSATGFLLWQAARIWPTLAGGIALATVWMLTLALQPAVLGRAIDAGLTQGDRGELIRWASVLLALGVGQAITGIIRHRFAVFNWLASAFRTVQVTTATPNRLGATLPKRVVAGEVVSIGTSDIAHIGSALDILSRGIGSVVAIVVVAVILLSTSVPLGLVVVLGVPLLMAVVGLLIRPLHRRQEALPRRSRASSPAGPPTSSPGCGCCAAWAASRSSRPATGRESQQLRRDGVRVARVDSLLEAAQVLLPGIFMVLVTWLGARFALRGEHQRRSNSSPSTATRPSWWHRCATSPR